MSMRPTPATKRVGGGGGGRWSYLINVRVFLLKLLLKGLKSWSLKGELLETSILHANRIWQTDTIVTQGTLEQM